MSYTVLARRYRSETFEDLIGQQALATTLVNAINSGRIAHAFLFTGVRGVGKTSAARILAKSLNCLKAKAPTPKPCLKCSSCTAIHAGEDIDVIEIDGASNNGVNDIRELRQNVVYRPNRARFKIYIIDEVHMLSVGAFNALLKTLEEPPAHVKFIFATTEPQKIPATILSRCQRYDFRTISETDIAEHLNSILKAEKIPAEPAAVEHIARLAAGSMRDALSILDQLLSLGQKKLTSEQLEQTLGKPNFRLVLDTVGALVGNDVSAALSGLDELIRLGHSLEQIVSTFIEHCRSLMLLLACGKDTKLVLATEENRQALLEQSAGLNVPTVIFFITVFEELVRAIRFSSSARALCEAAMVRLAAREKFVSTEEMIGLLESGPSGGGSSPRTKPNPSPEHKKPPAKAPTTPATGRRVPKEAVEKSKNNPLVSKTLQMFGGVVMNVSEKQTPQARPGPSA